MNKSILISNVQWYENWNDTLPTNFEIPEESCMASPELYALKKLGRCMKKYDGMDSQNWVQKKLSASGYHIELQRRIIKTDVTDIPDNRICSYLIDNPLFELTGNMFCKTYEGNQALENALQDCAEYKGKIEIVHDNNKKYAVSERHDVYLCADDDEQIMYCIAKGIIG